MIILIWDVIYTFIEIDNKIMMLDVLIDHEGNVLEWIEQEVVDENLETISEKIDVSEAIFRAILSRKYPGSYRTKLKWIHKEDENEVLSYFTKEH